MNNAIRLLESYRPCLKHNPDPRRMTDKRAIAFASVGVPFLLQFPIGKTFRSIPTGGAK